MRSLNILLVACLVAVLCIATDRNVYAQGFNDTFGGQIMGVEQQQILVLNQENLLKFSKSGQALLSKENAMKEAHKQEGLRLDFELESEELILTEKRDELIPEEFDKLAIQFDSKVVAVRRDHQQKSEALAGELDSMRKEFFSNIVPVVAKIMKERGASMVFEQRNVLFTGPDIDITAEVIQRLDSEAGLD